MPTWVDARPESAVHLSIAPQVGTGRVIAWFARPSHYAWAFLVPGAVDDDFPLGEYFGVEVQHASDAVRRDEIEIQFHVAQLAFKGLPDGTYTLFAYDERAGGERRERHLLQVRGDTQSVLLRFD